jgi:hypothetical protein
MIVFMISVEKVWRWWGEDHDIKDTSIRIAPCWLSWRLLNFVEVIKTPTYHLQVNSFQHVRPSNWPKRRSDFSRDGSSHGSWSWRSSVRTISHHQTRYWVYSCLANRPDSELIFRPEWRPTPRTRSSTSQPQGAPGYALFDSFIPLFMSAC